MNYYYDFEYNIYINIYSIFIKQIVTYNLKYIIVSVAINFCHVKFYEKKKYGNLKYTMKIMQNMRITKHKNLDNSIMIYDINNVHVRSVFFFF